MDVRWQTFPKGTKADAERFADKLRDTIGGTVYVGDYLAGIEAWEIWVGPPAREEQLAYVEAIADVARGIRELVRDPGAS